MISKNEVKYIQSLYHKKKRKEAGVFVAEGVKTASELLNSSFQVKKIYATADWADENKQVASLTTLVTEEELSKISSLKTPNKVLLIAEEKQSSTKPNWNEIFFLALDGIQDPGNLGTIIRTADWFGIEHIVASEETADVYNNKVIQATMGSFTRVQLHYTSLPDFFQKHSLQVYGALLDGKPVQSFTAVQNGCLMIGNEGKGIDESLMKYITHKITIPRKGKAESLNAAVAASILMSYLRA